MKPITIHLGTWNLRLWILLAPVASPLVNHGALSFLSLRGKLDDGPTNSSVGRKCGVRRHVFSGRVQRSVPVTSASPQWNGLLVRGADKVPSKGAAAAQPLRIIREERDPAH